MAYPTTDATLRIQEVITRMTTQTQTLIAQMQAESPTLETLEQTVLQHLKTLGQDLLTTLCALQVPRYADPTHPCPQCGGDAPYVRRRRTHVTTLIGDVTYERPYYLCPHCHQGHCLLDDHLDVISGSLSTGLHALCATIGTGTPFAEASSIIEQLSLVTVAPNTVRSATQDIGQALIAAEDTAMPDSPPPRRREAPPLHLAEPVEPPSAAYQQAARALVERCEAALWHGAYQRPLDYLRKRGFTDATLQAARIGYHAGAGPDGDRCYESRSAWGLPVESSTENGAQRRKERLWLPRGVVVGETLWGLLIRRPVGEPKYYFVPGKRNAPYGIDSVAAGKPVQRQL